MITEYKNTEIQLITQEEIKINVTGFDKRGALCVFTEIPL